MWLIFGYKIRGKEIGGIGLMKRVGLNDNQLLVGIGIKVLKY